MPQDRQMNGSEHHALSTLSDAFLAVWGAIIYLKLEAIRDGLGLAILIGTAVLVGMRVYIAFQVARLTKANAEMALRQLKREEEGTDI